MKLKLTHLFTLLFIGLTSFPQDSISEDTTILNIEQITAYYDSLENTLNYKNGKVDIDNGLADLKVPKNYKYLNPEQSAYILTDIWGNPPSKNLGMLFLKHESPFSDDDFSYAVEITYSEEGYIEDEDAKDLDYDDLLEEMQEDTRKASIERVKQDYDGIELVGWAAPPYYDEVNKKLHWAKEIKFDGTEINTLNYNIRVLGRKGYLNLNVIGDINQLPKVQKDIDSILGSINFNDGNKYSDFNPDVDDIAAYGIGGLIAGKVLAKVGFFALIIKFWKFIIIGVIAGFAGIKKFFSRNK